MDKLSRKEFSPLLSRLESWSVKEEKILEKDFTFPDFKQALSFVNTVGDLAEKENHHPDILLHGWNKVLLTLSTHSAGGLTKKDFALASRIDAIL